MEKTLEELKFVLKEWEKDFEEDKHNNTNSNKIG